MYRGLSKRFGTAGGKFNSMFAMASTCGPSPGCKIVLNLSKGLRSRFHTPTRRSFRCL